MKAESEFLGCLVIDSLKRKSRWLNELKLIFDDLDSKQSAWAGNYKFNQDKISLSRIQKFLLVAYSPDEKHQEVKREKEDHTLRWVLIDNLSVSTDRD